MKIVNKAQVQCCKIKGDLAGRKEIFEGVIYQDEEFIKIKIYSQHQIIKAEENYKKLLTGKIPAIIIKERRGYSLWILFKSLLTQKHSSASGSDFIRASRRGI